ncbi:L,D-transpeptidase family protein [Streptomyces sp. SID13031]|uniref:L,D-transpeptidase family protein n=1 Tax=Streptomyces sp. SID13031 TaxID=2706046 RepID=UPI0013C983F3|nr:L,D-transpeptidase family protein [Streptomyces sp. SID13031]NEA37553.1 L,D-transpeptidase family protein [Streptomyces sp. SID13031]
MPPGPPADVAKAPTLPVQGYIGDSQQLIAVKARGTYATVTMWNRVKDSWVPALPQTDDARVGSGGIVSVDRRRQGTGTTPAGSFALTEAFGTSAAAGSKLPYHRINADDYWVQDNSSAYYNTLRGRWAGGFKWWLPESNQDGSERLANYSRQYEAAVVIDFNRPSPVRGRGSGIFLHVNGRGATAGCVSVPKANMQQILRWLDPKMHPRILIG